MIVQYHHLLYPELKRLGLLLQEEAPTFIGTGWSDDKVHALMARPNVHTFFWREDDLMVGFMVTYLDRMFFNDTLIGLELVLYLMPEYRGHRRAALMVAEYERWAKMMGAKTTSLMQSTRLSIDSYRKYCENLGYTVNGFTTTKEL